MDATDKNSGNVVTAEKRWKNLCVSKNRVSDTVNCDRYKARNLVVQKLRKNIYYYQLIQEIVIEYEFGIRKFSVFKGRVILREISWCSCGYSWASIDSRQQRRTLLTLSTLLRLFSFYTLSQDEYGRPFIILRQQQEQARIKGVEAQKSNISAARSVSNLLRTSLGTFSMVDGIQSDVDV